MASLGFLFADLEIAADAIILFLADQWPHFRFAFERRAKLDALGFFGHGFDEFRVDLFFDQDAAASGADFALIDEDAEEGAVDGGFPVGVGEENIGGLAAELEGDTLEGVGGGLDDDFADGGAAGECDFVDVRDARRARAPAVSPNPLTMLTTPGGRPTSSNQFANSRTVSGVCSAGFSTQVQPAASAGASFQAAMSSG